MIVYVVHYDVEYEFGQTVEVCTTYEAAVGSAMKFMLHSSSEWYYDKTDFEGMWFVKTNDSVTLTIEIWNAIN